MTDSRVTIPMPAGARHAVGGPAPGGDGLQLLRAAPPPEMGPGEALAPYELVARRLTEFLLGNQVVAQDVTVPLEPRPDGSLEGILTTRLLRRVPEAIDVPLELRRDGGTWSLWGGRGAPGHGPFNEGEFVRIDLTGRLAGVPAFRGVRPPSPGFRSMVKAGLRRFRTTAALMVRAHHLAFERLPAFELSRVGGTTWRLRRIDPIRRRVELEAYDGGAIYDFHLNGEGVTLPPQVPGNHYGDAYAAYAFAWVYRRTGSEEYLRAALAALAFVRRVYPQYAATAFAMHHSDFKNPAFLEAVETLLAPVGTMTAGELTEARDLIRRFHEGTYNPTNVFALRFHWHAARAAVAADAPSAIDRCVARIRRDQTAEGLIQDNFIHYPDAHDLTYHQYALACLAQGLAWREDAEVRRRFLEGAAFSLALTTPDGEVAYVGRGANNVYHVASAVLAFETAARLRRGNPLEAGAFRRGARLLGAQLERWQQADGMLPTAMNPLIQERVAWNHCETPYNALVATLLQKASQVADATVDEVPLPMEAPGYLRVMDDSGFAAVRTDDLYAVLFAGCAPSYAWSGRTHRTGVAGLAQLGLVGQGALLPILDHPPVAGAPPVTDLPVVNGAAAYGRGRLRAVEGPLPAIHLRHAYGGAILERLYVFLGRAVVVVTRVRAVRPWKRLHLRGLAAVALRQDEGWSVSLERSGWVRATGPSARVTIAVLYTSPGLSVAPRTSPTVTNPRGRAVRVDLVDATSSGAEPVLACHAMSADPMDAEEVSLPTASRPNAECLVLASSGLTWAIRLDTWPRIDLA